jgi:citrate lyase subunit beta/citryl-CoA lyase
LRRSQLYVPGNNEKMIRKSTELEADSVVLDLEDSVPMNQKGTSRELIRRLVNELDWGKKELAIRINSYKTLEGLRDLAILKDIDKVRLVLVPKAEEDMSFIYNALEIAIEPIVETAKGLLKIEELASSKGVEAITWGPADLALSVGGNANVYKDNQFIRTLVVVTAKAYGLDAIDSVFFDLNNLKEFEQECRKAKELGFVGKQVIHPSQIVVANSIFSPTRNDIERAKKIVQAYEEAKRLGKGAIRFEGQMIDYVHYATAKKLLEQIGEKP